jgi:transposase
MKVIEFLGKGYSQRVAAEVFGLSTSTVSEWAKKYKETGEVKNKPLNRTFKKVDPEKLEAYMQEHPDAYLREIAEVFQCTDMSIFRALKKLNITRKKRRSDTASKSRSLSRRI